KLLRVRDVMSFWVLVGDDHPLSRCPRELDQYKLADLAEEWFWQNESFPMS
ncbi:hypothetical protein M2318_001428, partial [Metapseudomonas resinovorans]